jgi:hypothetical protein
MEHCVPLLLTDDSLFSHFVDETLLFHQEVHNLYDYASSDHQCLSVLVTPKCLDKWVELEHKCKSNSLYKVAVGKPLILVSCNCK